MPIRSKNTKLFCYINLNLKQHEDKSITVDQKEYVESLEPIKLFINRVDAQWYDPVADP